VDYAPCTIGKAVYPRPYLDVVLACDYGHHESFPLDALIDTGSDLCIFDWAIASTMGFDRRSVGQPSELRGLGSAEAQPSRIVPIRIYVPRLKRGFDIHAESCHIAKGLGVAAILGHNGFLDRLSVTFHRENTSSS
jgi:hypothetical protein